MKKTVVSTFIVRKRLKQEKDELGSYAKLAKKYDVNVRYLWELLTMDKIPRSKKVCNKLGIIPPSLERTRARREKLNEIARYLGYDSWCKFETYLVKKWESEGRNAYK